MRTHHALYLAVLLLLAAAVAAGVAAWQSRQVAEREGQIAREQTEARKKEEAARHDAEGLVGRQYVANGARALQAGDEGHRVEYTAASLISDVWGRRQAQRDVRCREDRGGDIACMGA